VNIVLLRRTIGSFKPLEVPDLDKRFSQYGPVAIALAFPAIVVALIGTIIMGFSGPNPDFGAAMTLGFVALALPYISHSYPSSGSVIAIRKYALYARSLNFQLLA
jgi:hypothetical protein